MNVDVLFSDDPNVGKLIGDLDAPIIFNINDPEERDLFTVRGWSTTQLVSFGNYMLNRFAEKIQVALASGDRIMPVTDADLANWKETL